jgi:hypothetical protein
MRVIRFQPGQSFERVDGAVLARDVRVNGERWEKGRRLTAGDLDRLATIGPGELPAGQLTLLVLERGDLHEDDAALRLAAAVAGDGLSTHGPAESRVDLRATHPGVVHVRIPELERLNRIDPLEVFTVLDGSIVREGDLIASVKVAPHVVREELVAAGERIARGGRRPLVWIAPFRRLRVGAVVLESLHALARERFENSVRTKIETLGSTLVGIDYAADEGDVERALRAMTVGPERVDLVLTAGGGSTDPADPFFVAVEALGGWLVRHGVPAHPGSMLWLGRVGRTAILGLPTCGAFSKATAADLVLPRLLTGERPTPRLVSGLGHGGILTRDHRFRFPAYARDLEAPTG